MQSFFESGPNRSGGRSSAQGLDLNAILGIVQKSMVLPNKAGLTDSMALVRYEALVTSVTIPVALARLQNSKQWGLRQWRLAHQIIFNPVYDWAGKIRTVNIQKKDRFVDKDSIVASCSNILSAFHCSYAKNDDLITGLKELPLAQFVKAIAQLYSDLTLVHPFREGNGRSLKIFVTAMARQVDVDFKWSKIATKKWEFDEACISGGHGDVSALAGLFLDIAEPMEPQEYRSPRRTRKINGVALIKKKL